ncbi:MAG: hypothetical protein RLZZ415_1902 [Pseudomonadota bacterium]
MLPRKTRFLIATLLAVAGLAMAGWTLRTSPEPPVEPIGLFTSLPVMWGEGGDLPDLLAAARQPHRVRQALAQVGVIKPQDRLEDLGPKLRRLVMAQPRPLAPSENLALDRWVRGGGELLLFADPMLTEPSAYALGDPRHPQDVVLLSPILARWGLELMFDEQQPGGVRHVALGNAAVPVNLPGFWRVAGGNCHTDGEGLLVSCQIGKGHVLALADAEVLSAQDPDQSRTRALASLLSQAFPAP